MAILDTGDVALRFKRDGRSSVLVKDML
jgi:hypothetical protein